MPQFVFIELPTFRIKDKDGNTVSLSSRHLGRIITLLQYVRSGLRAGGGDYPPELSASLLFGNQETDLWTATRTAPHHPEENLLLAYFQSFDSPGAYPIVDALLLDAKPCSGCVEYFSLGGRQLRPQLDDGTGTGATTAGAPFRAKFTPRVDKTYTPVFYPARGLDANQRAALWLQLAQMWSGGLGAMGVAGLASSPAVRTGEAYYLFSDPSAPWYALNGQENMNDSDIAEAITRQRLSPAYWIGRFTAALRASPPCR